MHYKIGDGGTFVTAAIEKNGEKNGDRGVCVKTAAEVEKHHKNGDGGELAAA